MLFAAVLFPHCGQGESPYKRATYRYTPLLAWLLTPNIYLHSCFGKVVFCVCDLLAGYVIYRLLLRAQHLPCTTALCCLQLWLLNPLTLAVSTRGNAESLMAALVLATLWLMTGRHSKGTLVLAAILYAASVHIKIYPVTYALPIYLHLEHRGHTGPSTSWHLWLTTRRLSFGAVGGLVLLGLTALCYYWWVSKPRLWVTFEPWIYCGYLLPQLNQ